MSGMKMAAMLKSLMAVWAALAVGSYTAPANAATSGADAACARLKASTGLLDAVVDETGILPSQFSSSLVPTKIDRPVCRVHGTIRPVPSSNIKFELWMPTTGWNGRYVQVGNGGLAGRLRLARFPDYINAGYAVGATDDGTAQDGGAASWKHDWLKDPQRIEDYAHRAVHWTAVNGKSLVAAFYGTPAHHAYFIGGSKGGQEGMMEATRYPEDFDGIVSKMPGMNAAVVASLHWNIMAMIGSPGSALSEDELLFVNKRVLAQCMDVAGVPGDDYLSYPLECKFDPGVLACSAKTSGQKCLSAAQVETLRKIYRGAHNPRTGEMIYPGLMPGSEGPKIGGSPYYPPAHGWLGSEGGLLEGFSRPVISKSVLRDENWDWRTFDFDQDYRWLMTAYGGVFNSNKPNLEAFRARGGKLIMTQGWNDPHTPPQEPIRYYDSVVAFKQKIADVDAGEARRQVDQFFRLFMIPGEGHGVSNAPVPPPVTEVEAVARWVEQGVAPDTLLAEKKTASGVISRPLCPHPLMAVWTGKGSTGDAENFVCADSPRRFK